MRVTVFLLTFLSVYDWLTLTSRLFHRACLLLALGAAVAFARWCGKREAPFCNSGKVYSLDGCGVGTRIRRNSGWPVAAGTKCGRPVPQPQSNAPNVLVIVVDTLRADHVSSYGYARPTTPESRSHRTAGSDV